MATLMRDFASALAGVERPGDFSTTGVVELSAPGLIVEGVGPVALPLLPVQAAALVGVADAAPFGRGEATIVDRDVRRTWQIDPGKVRIVGRHWPACLDRIVTRAASGLGVDTPVEAKFYKLLIYDEGSFFVGHRDTEKTPGMFATLVIVLPSDGIGGELVVRHQGREVRYELAADDSGEAAFAAFYADCVHEVLPVTNGHRLTLVYNLVRRGSGGRPQPPSYDTEVAKLAALLGNWSAGAMGKASLVSLGQEADEETEDEWSDEDELDNDDETDDQHGKDQDGTGAGGFEKIVYPLAHAYTPAELSFAALKGADAAAASVLTSAAEQAGCEVHLALLVIEEEGSAEEIYTGSSRRRSRYSSDDTDFEISEIFDTRRTLSEWRRPDAGPCSLGPLPFLEVELSPPDAFEDMEPDESHFREATGNEGASFDRTYRRAALVVWPRDRALAVLSQAGLAVTLPALGEMVRASQGTGGTGVGVQRRAAQDLAGHMMVRWPRRPPRPRSPDAAYPKTFLRLLRDLGDADLIRRFLLEVVLPGACPRDDHPAILDALETLPKQDRIGLLTRIVAARAKGEFAACADLLACAAHRPKARPHHLAEAATALVANLPGNPDLAEWRRTPTVDPDFVTDLMWGLPPIDEAQARRAAEHILRWPKTFGFDAVVVPALCAVMAKGTAIVAKDKEGWSPSVERLRSAALAHLDARIAQPLAEPTDYRRDAALGCKCKDCAAAAA